MERLINSLAHDLHKAFMLLDKEDKNYNVSTSELKEVFEDEIYAGCILPYFYGSIENLMSNDKLTEAEFTDVCKAYHGLMVYEYRIGKES